MKSLHRAKAISAYEGARLVLKNEQVYPSYMLLKEAARGVLSYIAEDCLDTEICEKTKLDRLLEFMKDGVISDEDARCINLLIDAERGGLQKIITMDLNDLKSIKKSIKKLISTCLGEHM